MVKAILFDFWGTLAEQGVWSPVKQIKNILQIDVPFSDYITRMEHAFMTQEFSNLQEAFENICREFNIEPSEEKIQELIGLWNKSWMLAQPYSETIEVLKKLREEYQIILISNTNKFSLPQVLEKFQLNELFDQIFFSYQMGAIKTDKIFLKSVLTKLNLTPQDCVLVGDSVQSDIIPGRRADIKTVLIDRKNTREFHPKIKNLNDLAGVLSQ
ncbi:HAD family hydrolase [Candidatus Woesearchaeota archaeon]|nr:HAD family hydrolase [Candidatus Woesearchaeota archaeon]